MIKEIYQFSKRIWSSEGKKAIC